MNQFAGAEYSEEQDKERLVIQMNAIRDFMLGTGLYWTVQELETQLVNKYQVPFPQNSIQAQIRNLKKKENGGYGVTKRQREGTNLWEYRLSQPRNPSKREKTKSLTKKEKGLVLEELLELTAGKKPSPGLMKLLRWLSDGSV